MSKPMRIFVVGVVLTAVLSVTAGSAAAEPLCTTTWTGPAEGAEWSTGEDWSGGVPTSTSVACVGTGKTVLVFGEQHTGVL